MNKNYYFVTFEWYNSGIFCSNIVVALNKDKDAVKDYYNEKYGWCSIRDVQEGELNLAIKKGMPVVELR